MHLQISRNFPIFFLLKITIKSKELTPLPPCPKTFTFSFFFFVLDPYRFLDMNSDYSLGKVTLFLEVKFGVLIRFFEKKLGPLGVNTRWWCYILFCVLFSQLFSKHHIIDYAQVYVHVDLLRFSGKKQAT